MHVGEQRYTREFVIQAVRGWRTRKLPIIVVLAIMVVGVYAGYVHRSLSVIKKADCVQTISKDVPSASGNIMAHLTFSGCRDDGGKRFTTTVWLGRPGSSTETSVFIGYGDNATEGKAMFDQVRVEWLNEATLMVEYPARMTLASEPGQDMGVTVDYRPRSTADD